MSSAQRRLWFLDQLEPGQSAYTLGASHLLEAPVEARVLEQAINDVVRRQGSLRTVFRTVDGEPVQVVQPFEPVSLPLVDLSSLPPEEQDPAARRHVREEATRPFDLARGPLFRVMLLRVAAGRHLLLYSLHHIIGDGWSLGIFLDDLRRAYAARLANRPPALPPLAVHYGQHAIRERERLTGPFSTSCWTTGASVSLARRRRWTFPPTVRGPRVAPSMEGRFRSGSRRAHRQAARPGARRAGIGVHDAAGSVQRADASHQRADRRRGWNAVANRPTPELEGVIGMFVGTLPLRTDLGSDPGTRELIAQVRESVLDAQAHAELPFERLVDELRPQRSMAWSPIFQVVFALQNTPLASSFDVTTVAAMYDLSLFMWDEPQGIRGTFEYNTALFDGATVERMASHFVTLAEGMAAEPDRPVSRVPLLTAAQRAQVLVDWNDTARDYPRDMRLHALFRRAAALHRDAIALETTDPAHEILPVSRLTYAELDTASDRLAARLHERGVRAGHAVGLYAARSMGAVVGMLAIAKAGGAPQFRGRRRCARPLRAARRSPPRCGRQPACGYSLTVTTAQAPPRRAGRDALRRRGCRSGSWSVFGRRRCRFLPARPRTVAAEAYQYCRSPRGARGDRRVGLPFCRPAFDDKMWGRARLAALYLNHAHESADRLRRARLRTLSLPPAAGARRRLRAQGRRPGRRRARRGRERGVPRPHAPTAPR